MKRCSARSFIMSGMDNHNRKASLVHNQTGRHFLNKDSVKKFSEEEDRLFQKLDHYLRDKTYLVGDRLSMADFFVAVEISYLAMDKKVNRFTMPNFARWFNTCTQQDVYKKCIGNEALL